MKVNILGISSSPRRGNTLIMVHEALKSARQIGDVETTLYSFKGKNIAPCIDCDLCSVSDEQLCDVDDSMTELFPLLSEADAIIHGLAGIFRDYQCPAQVHDGSLSPPGKDRKTSLS